MGGSAAVCWAHASAVHHAAGTPVLSFLPARPRGFRPREHRWLARLLLIACASTAAATAWTWLQPELLAVAGEPGWRTQSGFTCLATCLLLALLTVIDTGNSTAREAVRHACAFVALVTAGVVAADIVDGPGTVRGIAASWTVWFWAAVAGVAAVSGVCCWRLPQRRPPPA
jgi:hypothetical protein